MTVTAGAAVLLDSVDLEVDAGELTVVVGPSGAGKTTLLRAIAGLTDPSSGQVTIAGRDVGGVPTHQRRIGMVFQEPRLFPHLDVADNVAYPLRLAGYDRAERRGQAMRLLDEVGLAALADRPVRGLSGGEAQRVALARALAADPEVLLLDEPLGAVDPERRADLRALVGTVQRQHGLTTVFVTHDRGEAAELGDRIALLVSGRILQHAPASELFERPRTPAVARFVGASNLLPVVVRDGEASIGGHKVTVAGPDGPALLAVRPERIRLGDGGIEVRVASVTYVGTHVRLGTDLSDGARLEVHVATDRAPRVGDTVHLEIPSAARWRVPDDDVPVPPPDEERP